MNRLKNLNQFNYITLGEVDNINFCIILFCFLYSSDKRIFDDTQEAFPLNKYREFFCKLRDFHLLKNTKFETDLKYRNMLNNFMENKNIQKNDAAYFFQEFENCVNIKNKDSIHNLKKYVYVSFFLLFLSLFMFCQQFIMLIISKAFSCVYIIKYVLPPFFCFLFGLYIFRICYISLKVENNKEKNPKVRFKYRNLDLNFCVKILNYEMQNVYNKISESFFEKQNLDSIYALLTEIENNVAKQDSKINIQKSLEEIKEKLKPMEDLSNIIDFNFCNKEREKNIKEMIDGMAPIHFYQNQVRYTKSVPALTDWLIEENYDQKGLDKWIVNNIFDKNGECLKLNTVQRALTKSREKYKDV